MFYLLLKSIHILSVVIWIGALFIVTLVTSKNRLNQSQMALAVRVTEASIGVAWLMGIVLVIHGDWYASTWFHIKLALVFLISAIHTFLHRRWKNQDNLDNATNGSIPIIVFTLSLFVILLVVFKIPV